MLSSSQRWGAKRLKEINLMKKIVFTVAALSFAALTYAPISASAAPMRERASIGAMMHPHHYHCHIVKTKVKRHGHWVWSTRKVCH